MIQVKIFVAIIFSLQLSYVNLILDLTLIFTTILNNMNNIFSGTSSIKHIKA